MTEQVQRRGRKQLIVMVLIAAASVGGSYALYFATVSGGTWGTVNHGTFVAPALQVSDLELVDAAGASIVDLPYWWIWVVQAGNDCDAACEHALHQLRQLHILLHRDAGRVKRALVTPTRMQPGELDDLYPELEFLSGPVERLQPGIYLVDPLGNLVLRYPLEAAGKPVLEDLKRLLKVSQIG
jgi:cytochrome oxidase Cu insertion factor (SCO1/SenC/PrrC family)